MKDWSFSINWRLIFSVIMWYTLNCVYVVQQKAFLNILPVHVTFSGFLMILGSILSLLIWAVGWRDLPRFKGAKRALKIFFPLAMCHLLVNYGAVISMGIGAVSFTQVIKAGEPVFTATLSILVLREFLNVYAYLSLIPIVVGISLASVKELDFNIWAFLFAMLSNLGSSSRAILAKITMKNKDEIGENLTAANIYMILTLISGTLSVPLVLCIEAYKWKPLWVEHTANLTTWQKCHLLLRAFISAVSYYSYNDFAFYCLGQINQVGHSVANTLKRVFVIVVSIIIFSNPVTPLGYVGMVMAVLGALSYSLSNQGFFNRKQKEAAEVRGLEIATQQSQLL
ncbi:Phosphoenolpyruvate/phosphate translocator [Babesia sp. Xinjiang]|uniref:Phosphoenolpyruvate/phosphate translocator n=1 Tax=Babesia sp. Xinjiang TaxID=462227 RepID=UPI000A236197|nr:Phosphoenolpyruvate/phosphate translocator [Babesia sp. Xinjiang]ORM41253.1 Phosphoenolpyruvate/phosphate translocator [Babesia sp. Xinjiang]